MERIPMIKFWYPGILFSEDSSKESDHNRNHLAVEVPEGAYAFQFYDKVIKKGVLEDGEEIEKVTAENHSPTYYPDGEILDYDQVVLREEVDGKDYKILLSNMKCNDMEHVCFHRCCGVVDVKEDDVAYEYTR